MWWRLAPRTFVGVVDRQLLVASLTSSAAVGTTFELAAEQGPAQADLEPLFALLQADTPGGLDAVLDVADMPLEHIPPTIREQLHDIRDRWRT
jgi:hypothetical protein